MFPIIFETSIFTVFSLWLFTAIGFIVGAIVFYQLVKNSRLDLAFFTDHGGKLLISTLVFSRLAAIISRPIDYLMPYYSDESWWMLKRLWNIISIWDKGFSFWGAFVGFLIMFIYLGIKHEKNLAKWADVLSISSLIGMAIGHIGAYLDGINYGKPTSLFWGITYQNSSVKYAIPVHPTQIYAFLMTTAIACVLYILYRRYRNQYDGLVAYLGIFLFSVSKLIENLFRGDDALIVLGLRFSTIFFVCIAVASGIMVYLYTRTHSIPLIKTIVDTLSHPFKNYKND